MKIIAICYAVILISLLSACDNQVTKSKITMDSIIAKVPTDLLTIPKDHFLSDHLKAMEKAKDVEKQLKDALKERMSIVD